MQSLHPRDRRSAIGRPGTCLLLICCASLLGCNTLGPIREHLLEPVLKGAGKLRESLRARPSISQAEAYQLVEQQIEIERQQRLLSEITRLREDLRHAEEALIAAESGLVGRWTRADAVSALAEARIEIDRARLAAPWRARELLEASEKAEESDRHVQNSRHGAAIFFASRAQRMAEALVREGEQAESAPNTRWIVGQGVNMRTGPSTGYGVIGILGASTPVFEEKILGDWALVRTPSGQIGWVHRRLLAAGS